MSAISLAGGNTMLTSGSFPPVRAATTAAITLSGLQTIDGVALAADDRVLVKDQADATTNGIYAAATGPWTRVNDARSNSQFFSGMTVTAGPGGAVNAGKTFVCTCPDDPVQVGTSQITWAAQSDVQTAQQQATSTTSLTIGTGPQTLAIQAGKAFQVNQEVLVYETSNTANSMLGQVTAYAGTSLTVNVTNVKGSGTHADWTVVLYNSTAAAGITPPIGVGDVAGPGTATDGHVALFNGATGKVIKDSGIVLGALASLSSVTPQLLVSSTFGYGTPMVNGTLVASVAANALTIALKTLAGADPSAADPVWIFVPNSGGGYAAIPQTAALSITIPSGATLGTVSAQANRIWVGFSQTAGGANFLAVYNSLNSTGPSIVPWDETTTTNFTGISAAATSPQLWYGTAAAGRNFRVIGLVESTQAAAGIWATAPGKVMLFGPGVKRPEETFPEQTLFSNTAPTVTSTTFAALAGANLSIPLTSAANLVHARSVGTMTTSAAGSGLLQLSRGTVNNTNMIGVPVGLAAGTTFSVPAFLEAYDIPNTTLQSYAVQAKSGAGLTVGNGGNGGGSPLTGFSMVLREVQI